MASTGFASLVRHAGRGVALGLAALAIAGGGLLAAPAAPASAASAMTVSLTAATGSTVVCDWDTDSYTFKVRNTGSTTLSSVYVEVYHDDLPLDFQAIIYVSGKSMACEIVDDSALGGARAACELNALGVGEESVYRLRTHTTWAGFSRVRYLEVQGYYNYPVSTTVDARGSVAIAVNP